MVDKTRETIIAPKVSFVSKRGINAFCSGFLEKKLKFHLLSSTRGDRKFERIFRGVLLCFFKKNLEAYIEYPVPLVHLVEKFPIT